VVVLHGGFWRARYGKWIMAGVCEDLVARGYAAWNLEYRRLGPLAHGGVPNTLDDVAAGTDFLATIADEHALDLSRVAVVGHSAGGHLALWLAGRADDADAAVAPVVFIALAAVANLALAHELELGAGVVHQFTGGAPADKADNYALASPIERLPTGKRVVVIHGTEDETVPIVVARTYVAEARAAGDDVEFLEFGCDHLTLMDPRAPEWQYVVDRLP
jgi:acetyl esterase/lipase